MQCLRTLAGLAGLNRVLRMRVWSRSRTSVLRGRPSGPGRCGGSSGRRLRRATFEMCGRLERKFRYSAASSAYPPAERAVSVNTLSHVPCHVADSLILRLQSRCIAGTFLQLHEK